MDLVTLIFQLSLVTFALYLGFQVVRDAIYDSAPSVGARNARQRGLTGARSVSRAGGASARARIPFSTVQPSR
jgi:hypothetical protein